MPSRKNRRHRKNKRQRQGNVRYNSPSTSVSTSQNTINTVLELLNKQFEDTLAIDADLDKHFVNRALIYDDFFILGEGSFGLVTLGTFTNSDGKVKKVALKGVTSGNHIKMLKEEAAIMTNFDHDNVVKFLGVQKSPFKIIIEYMEQGDILDAVKAKVFVTGKDFMDVLIQVSTGMEYLAANDYIHRDLACRNVFVNYKRQCKIGDFGLCRYVGDTGGVYEQKVDEFFKNFSAPEAITSFKFTTKSDVWLMGLLIWELYVSASGVSPFIKLYAMETFMYIGKLPRPDMCPLKIFNYAVNVLLHDDPERRPFFPEVRKELCKMRNELILKF